MDARDFDRVMSDALQPDQAGGPHPTVDLAATAWQEGRRRHTRRLLAGGGGGVALVAAAAAAAFALGGGITPDASVTMPAGTGTVTHAGPTDPDAEGATPPTTTAEQSEPTTEEPTTEDPSTEDTETSVETAAAPGGSVPIGYSVSVDAPADWVTVPMDIYPEEQGGAQREIRRSCVAPADAFATDGCLGGVTMEVGWGNTPPDDPDRRLPEYLECRTSDRAGALVTSVEETGDSRITVDGGDRNGFLRTWLATCSDGSTFPMQELYIPSASLLMHQENGSADLVALATESLSYDGSPDLRQTVLIVDDLQPGAWSGEIQDPDADTEDRSTGERLTINLDGVTCRGGGTPPGPERGVTCGALADEIREAQQNSDVLLRVILDTNGAVLSVTNQFSG